VTIGGVLTLFRIKRDHSDDSCFFTVSVPEVDQYGAGLQVNVRGVLYGASVHTKARRK